VSADSALWEVEPGGFGDLDAGCSLWDGGIGCSGGRLWSPPHPRAAARGKEVVCCKKHFLLQMTHLAPVGRQENFASREIVFRLFISLEVICDATRVLFHGKYSLRSIACNRKLRFRFQNFNFGFGNRASARRSPSTAVGLPSTKRQPSTAGSSGTVSGDKITGPADGGQGGGGCQTMTDDAISRQPK